MDFVDDSRKSVSRIVTRNFVWEGGIIFNHTYNVYSMLYTFFYMPVNTFISACALTTLSFRLS